MKSSFFVRHRRILLLAASLACAIATTLSTHPGFAQSAPPVKKHQPLPGMHVYDETADPAKDLQSALAKARAEHKRVLVVFGANWCPDCRALDGEFHGTSPTAELVGKRYEIVKVDVGDFDKNLDFAKLYGEPIKKGIPSIVVVTPTNEVVYQTKAGELADARSMGANGIYTFFKDQADKPVGG
jgi:thioredoxin 1